MNVHSLARELHPRSLALCCALARAGVRRADRPAPPPAAAAQPSGHFHPKGTVAVALHGRAAAGAAHGAAVRGPARLRGVAARLRRGAAVPADQGRGRAASSGTWRVRLPAAGQGLRQHPPVAAAAGRAQHGLRPVRGRAGSHLAGARFRPLQHQLHQGRHRLDRVRPAGLEGDGRRGARVRQRAARRAAGRGRGVLAFARRPLRRRARRDRRGRRQGRQGAGHRAGRASCTPRSPENVYAGNAMVRRAFYQYGLLLPRSPFGHVDQAIGKTGIDRELRPDRADARGHAGLRGAHRRRRPHGVPEHAGHRGAGRNEHLVPAVQGLLGGREHHRDHPQHLHAARRAGARPARVVEGDQRGAVPVRQAGRGDVRRAQLAALGQRAHPGR